MGYYCILIQVRERKLMDMDEEEIVSLFPGTTSPCVRSIDGLVMYELPTEADLAPPPISLDKMWYAVHFLLTGSFSPSSSPLSRAILGGTPLGTEIGDGPPRYLWAHEVREIEPALSALSREELRRRYDPAGLKSNYLWTSVCDNDDEQELFEGLIGYVELLATYYRIAAKRGNAMLVAVI